MLLAIDCGNTNTVFALFESDIKLAEWRLETVSRRPADEYFIALCHVFESQKLYYTDIEDCILASVVPDVTRHLARFCVERLAVTPMIVGEDNVKLNLDVKTDDPEQVGADRLVNAVAAAAAGDVPAIILDFGTATTFDIVRPAVPDSDYLAIYAGGVIAPGVYCSVEALVAAAAKLPSLAIDDFEKNLPILGTSTQSAMKSGVLWGYVGLIDGLLSRLKAEPYMEEAIVIGTGGLASLFAPHIDAINKVDNGLTMNGLRIIFNRNKG
jgi:type III pantothenate kinase